MSLKTTGLPATSSVIATDLVAVVTDPPGTPASKRITAQHLADSLAGLAGSVDEAFVESAIESELEDLLGGVQYQGTWNATTNSPTIPAAASGNKGHYYKVATAGTTNIDGITDWQVGDVIVSNGAAWDKWDHTTPAASETVAGVVELANTAEMIAGTAADRAVTPALLMNAFQLPTVNVTEKGGTVTLDPGDSSHRIPDLDAMIVNVVTLPPAGGGTISIMLPPAKAGKILIISRSGGEGDLHLQVYTGETMYSPHGNPMFNTLGARLFLVLFGVTWLDDATTKVSWAGAQFGLGEGYLRPWPQDNNE